MKEGKRTESTSTTKTSSGLEESVWPWMAKRALDIEFNLLDMILIK